ncbi:MAG TPA: hypothetical protein VKB68_08430 [Stellaceae bacterium]|nr:hypothetical protein [Stellaceae bacterium]
MFDGRGLVRVVRKAGSTLTFDVIVKSGLTSFMRHARSFGCPTFGGYAMMETQVDEAITFLDGRT